jgi:hypothetical protein|tara:strand:- start:137 stop:328 length:192 start_codon:yes stop_codon:yes gene_type:complete
VGIKSILEEQPELGIMRSRSVGGEEEAELKAKTPPSPAGSVPGSAAGSDDDDGYSYFGLPLNT